MGEFHRNGALAPGLPTKLDVSKEADRNWLAIHSIRIKLDGEEMQRVVAFNTRRGILRRQKTGDDGRIALTPKGRPAIETLKGKVTVEWR